MPRPYSDREERSYHNRDSKSPVRSPRRQKRSRSRERQEKSRKSPYLSKYKSTNVQRKERSNSKGRHPDYDSIKLEGKWAKHYSDSENDSRDNKTNKRSKKFENDNYKRKETHDPIHNNYASVKSENLASSGLLENEKEGPNMALSGKLMEDTNVHNGVVVKYSEPPEAKKPKRRWRFYVFKGEETMPVLHLHRQSAYLLGKDRKVADIPIDHPSCSRQHAVLQYRCVPGNSVDGQKITRVLPYIIDLESSNGTFLNNKKIEPKRYMELREKDVLKFGFSSREYVLLHDQSDGD